MKNIIGYKLLGLFFFLVVSMGTILFFHIENVLNDKEVSYIENRLIKEVKYSDNILSNYHQKILKQNRLFVDPQTYLGIVRELSQLVKKSGLFYIRSYIKSDNGFILTATSATDAQFLAESYDDFGSLDRDDIDILSKAYKNGNNKYIFTGNKIALTVEKGGYKYIVLSEVDKEKVFNVFKEYYILLGSLIVISVFVFLIIYKMIISMHKRFKAIDNSLDDIFDYLLDKKSAKDIRSIKDTSNDQLGFISKKIDENIGYITDKFEAQKRAKIADEKVILELTEVLESAIYNYFDNEVKSVAYSSELNRLKDTANSMLLSMKKLKGDVCTELESYIEYDFIAKIDEDEYEKDAKIMVQKLNKLAYNQSEHLMKLLEDLMELSSNNRLIETHIDRFTEDLHYLLASFKDITKNLDSDYKFVFEFDKSIETIKRENNYINNLFKKFGKKYEESVALLDDLKQGVFKDNKDGFIKRLDAIIEDSSIKDDEAQERLRVKLRELTRNNLSDISHNKVKELLKLLTEEMLKDIKYSLYLIEKRIEKLSKESSTRLVLFESIEKLSKSMKDVILQELKNSEDIETILNNQINKNRDMERYIVDRYKFVGRKEMFRFLSQKGEL